MTIKVSVFLFQLTGHIVAPFTFPRLSALFSQLASLANFSYPSLTDFFSPFPTLQSLVLGHTSVFYNKFLSTFMNKNAEIKG